MSDQEQQPEFFRLTMLIPLVIDLCSSKSSDGAPCPACKEIARHLQLCEAALHQSVQLVDGVMKGHALAQQAKAITDPGERAPALHVINQQAQQVSAVVGTLSQQLLTLVEHAEFIIAQNNANADGGNATH
jgi:Zn ribbon nucleic-acid-binding protein